MRAVAATGEVVKWSHRAGRRHLEDGAVVSGSAAITGCTIKVPICAERQSTVGAISTINGTAVIVALVEQIGHCPDSRDLEQFAAVRHCTVLSSAIPARSPKIKLTIATLCNGLVIWI